MKLKCRCGHEVQVRSADGSTRNRCIYCGREYTVSRGSEGKLSIKVGRPAEPEAKRSPQKDDWPEDLALELDEPVAPQPAHREAAPARPRPARIGRPGAQEADVPMQERRNWFYYVGDAWGYPFRGQAKWVLLGWLALNVFVAPFLCFHPVLCLLTRLAMLGLLVLYEFELVRQSAFGAEADPSLPAYEDWHESMLRPLGLLVAVVIGSGLPFFAVVLPGLFLDMPGWWRFVNYTGLGVSLFMLPITMLAVAASDSPAGINPKFTFPAVLQIPFAYVLCAVFCAVCLVGGSIAGGRLALALGGGFPGAFAGGAVRLYAVTIAARALGTLHYAYSDRMGWLK